MTVSTKALGAVSICLLVTGSLFAGGPRTGRMEIVSRRGSQKCVKLYSGEVLTFHAREKREGIGDIFSPGAYLHGVTFTLREWPRPRDREKVGIIDGVNRRVVCKKEPADRALWGTPPSSFQVEGGGAGRYRLEASKSGYAPTCVILQLASFKLTDLDGDLGPEHYRVSFDISLVDPDEAPKAVPLLIESLSEEGAVIDSRDDVALVPLMLGPGQFRSSRRITLWTGAVESFRDRYGRRKERPLPGEFFDTKSLRIAEGGALRLSFRSLRVVYPLPFR